MFRKMTLLSIATALVMLVSLAAAPQAWGWQTYEIECRDSETDEPIANVMIFVWVQIGPDPENPEHWNFEWEETNEEGKLVIIMPDAHPLATYWRAEFWWIPNGYSIPGTWTNPMDVYYAGNGRYLFVPLVPE
ncbi:MAG: hypothetical protein FJY67_10160 [Calditrichaeota bacterium]|nr:hypothetical protein [Calditrichota bacterium]